MIGKVAKAGRGFRGVIAYLLEGARDTAKDPARVAWSETRNLFSDRPEHAPKLMRATAQQNTRVRSPVYHYVISWHKNEAPTDDLMREVADTTCEDLDLAEHQRVYIAHTDTDHRHVHIVVNRVHPETGKAWNRRQDWVRIEQSLKRQADDHGLSFVPGRHNTPEKMRDTPRRARDGSYRRARKAGRGGARDQFTVDRIKHERERLLPLFEVARSWSDLDARLAQAHLRLERKGQGLVIADDTGEMKLSSLGKQIRLPALEDRFDQTFDGYLAERPARTSDSDRPPSERHEDSQRLADAQAETDMAFTLHRAGLVDRKQLARSVRERDAAKEAADAGKSFADKIRDDVGKALKPDRTRNVAPTRKAHRRPDRDRGR